MILIFIGLALSLYVNFKEIFMKEYVTRRIERKFNPLSKKTEKEEDMDKERSKKTFENMINDSKKQKQNPDKKFDAVNHFITRGKPIHAHPPPLDE